MHANSRKLQLGLLSLLAPMVLAVRLVGVLALPAAESVGKLAADHTLTVTSNGAHAIAAMIDGSGGEICRRFSAYLIVEGGGKLQHYEYLKGKRYLMVSSQPGSKPRAQQIADLAKAAGAQTSFLYANVGTHAFPESAYPDVRTWLNSAVRE